MELSLINLCPTGMVPTKAQNSYLPVTPQEIGNCVSDCAKLGASIVHIHPRDSSGNPTSDPNVFKSIVDEIRSHNEEIIICATTSGRVDNTFESRSSFLKLQGDYKPDMASLTMGSNNFARSASTNSPQMIRDLASMMIDHGIKPEIEVFEPGMLNTALFLMHKGVLESECPYFNVLLDSPGTSPLSPQCFAAFYSLLPANSVWSVAGIGKNQIMANTLGLLFGGGARVGLEDNIYDQKGLPTSNQALVANIMGVAASLGKQIATISEVRKALNI